MRPVPCSRIDLGPQPALFWCIILHAFPFANTSIHGWFVKFGTAWYVHRRISNYHQVQQVQRWIGRMTCAGLTAQ